MTKTIYPASIELEHFDPNMYDLYWRFVAERQRVYVRRAILEQPFPWSADPILTSEFITNNYRELDPGTQYVIEEILGMEAPEDRVFNVMLYRLMGSNADAHALIKTPVKHFDPEAMVTRLDEYAASGSLIFGDAYRVAGYHTEGGTSKHDNISRMFARIKSEVPEIMRRLEAASGTKAAFVVLKSIPGFGEFLAHQITVDLLYKNNVGEAVLPFGQNEWAQAGPGARAGIWQMLKPNVKPRNLLMVMQYLYDHQQEEFATRDDIGFAYLRNDEDTVLLSLCNIQSTLCEFFKYARIWTGETKSAVRKYVPSGAPIHVIPVALEESQIAAIGDAKQALTDQIRPTVTVVEDEFAETTPVQFEEVHLPASQQPASTQMLEATLADGTKVSIQIFINIGTDSSGI